MIKKFYEAKVKTYDERDLTLEHFISSERPDRLNDVVRVDGMRIEGKPVVLVGHDYKGEPWAKSLWIRPGKLNGYKGLIAKTQFFPNETGKRLFRKAVDGYMPNFSIGFTSIKDKPRQPYGTEYLVWLLLEYSQVAVPTNPDATTMTIKMLRLDARIDDGLARFVMGIKRRIGSKALNEIIRNLEIKYRKRSARQLALEKLAKEYGIK